MHGLRSRITDSCHLKYVNIIFVDVIYLSFPLTKWILSLSELWWIGTQATTCWSHHWRWIKIESYLRISWRISCSWFGFGDSLWHLSTEACKCSTLLLLFWWWRQTPNNEQWLHVNDFQTQGPIMPHCIVALPNSNGMQLLLCYENEGVFVNTVGRVSKNIVLQVIIYLFEWVI